MLGEAVQVACHDPLTRCSGCPWQIVPFGPFVSKYVSVTVPPPSVPPTVVVNVTGLPAALGLAELVIVVVVDGAGRIMMMPFCSGP
jgi:hypothetical protein